MTNNMLVTTTQLITYLKKYHPETRVVLDESQVTYPTEERVVTLDSALALIQEQGD